MLHIALLLAALTVSAGPARGNLAGKVADFVRQRESPLGVFIGPVHEREPDTREGDQCSMESVRFSFDDRREPSLLEPSQYRVGSQSRNKNLCQGQMSCYDRLKVEWRLRC